MLLKKTKKKSLSCRNKGFKIWSSLSVILSLHLESPLSSPSPFIQTMYFIPPTLYFVIENCFFFISMMKIFMKEAMAKKSIVLEIIWNHCLHRTQWLSCCVMNSVLPLYLNIEILIIQCTDKKWFCLSVLHFHIE